MKLSYFILALIPIYFLSCGKKSGVSSEGKEETPSYYSNPLLEVGAEPWAIYHNGKYYYTQGEGEVVKVWSTSDITDLKNAESKIVWVPKEASNSRHLWAPEIHFLDGKWYVYFAADDGNMDNHQIYVIENTAENPFDGEFVMKGRIKTDMGNNWAIHPNVFEHKGDRYMIWSGWQSRRVETETQCIYIAKMENPWTLSSDRVLISKPEYEWERQWFNPDGTKTPYPIYVNEGPQAFHSKNKDNVLIYYSASGNWTPYYSVGLLTADANSDLLNPNSWKKSELPIFRQSVENNAFSTGNLCFIPSPDGTELYYLYHGRDMQNSPFAARESRSPRLQKMEWDENGMPVLGIPQKISETFPKPSGTISKK